MSTHLGRLPDDDLADLAIHDAPHTDADTEEWHINCHVRDARDEELSVFATFSRMAFPDPADGDERMLAHAVVWAVSDPATKAYHPASIVDQRIPGYVKHRLCSIPGVDTRMRRALAEVFDHGRVPLPDHLMETAPVVEPDGLHLAFDGCDLARTDGGYDVALVNQRGDVSCNLRLHPRGPAVRHGTNGFVGVGGDEETYHYFLPGCDVSGRVELPGGRTFDVVEGTGWFDHRFDAPVDGTRSECRNQPGSASRPEEPRPHVAWTWTNIALGDGGAVSAYEVIEPSTRSTIDRKIVVVDVDGTVRTSAQVKIESRAIWRSERTFREYPTSYRLVSKDLDLELDLEACSADQEFLTALSPPAFWEGRCAVHGTIGGLPVSGLASLVQRGVDVVEDIDVLLGRVGAIVTAAVEEVLPRRPTGEALHRLVGTASPRKLRGIDADVLGATIAQPIRSIVDRRGKAWRSFVSLTCCEAVGGDSRGLRTVLAVPEIIHAGSLIIDDIEDASPTRRGGVACHVEYGQPLALNAGNAAYFIAPEVLMSFEPIRQSSDCTKVLLYELYFRAMRGAHAGQAMDLRGVSELMPSAVATGDVRQLEERILACYRFKTGVPAACFAAMGAVLGGGNQRQINAVSDYLEAAGIAFQIIDDVLNLTGFERGQKTTGEDVFNGTITLPTVRALGQLDLGERRELWSKYQAASEDRSLVSDIVGTLEACDSFRSCRTTAQTLIDEEWALLESVLEPSHATVVLRAFSWFVIERQY